MKNNWKICKYFIFRCAGFPFELIEKIKFKDTSQAIDQLLQKNKVDSCNHWVKEIFEQELYRKRLELQEIASTEKFQEAVFHQNQHNYQNGAYKSILNFSEQTIDRNIRNQNSRRKELLTYRYLQRFCTKNETVSFFGPFYIGKFHNNKENILFRSKGTNKIKNRKVYISTWLLKEISDRILQDDEIFKMLKPRLLPRIYLNGSQAQDLITGSKIEIELDNVCLRVLRLVDQGHNVAEISLRLSKNGINKEEVFAKIRQLIKNRFLLSGLETAANSDEPDKYLINRLSKISAAMDNKWYVKLKRLSQLKSRFEKENFANRLHIVTELNELFLSLLANPKHKNIKLGKGFFTEYCEANIEQLKLGKNMYRDLQDSLSFILNLALHNITKIERIKYNLLHNWLKGNFKNREINIKDIFYQIAKASNRKNPLFKLGNIDFSNVAVSVLPSVLLDVFDQYKKSRVIRFNRRELERRFDAYLDKTEIISGTCCDIFICSSSRGAINKGDYKVVFGESHVMRKPLSIYKFFVETSSQGASLIREFKNIHKSIGKHYALGEFLTMPRDIWDMSYDFSTIAQIESNVYSERKKNKIRLSNLKLKWNNNSVNIVEGKKKTPVLLLNPLSGICSLFSISHLNIRNRRLAKVKTHFPKIEISRFVIQRERWVFLKNELFFAQESYNKKGLELWIELEEWRKRENLPKHFFLDIGVAIKPVFIDFENYFAIEVFMNFVKKAKGKIGIVEMLPGPENLWFKDNEGRYTSELRLILYKCAITKGRYMTTEETN